MPTFFERFYFPYYRILWLQILIFSSLGEIIMYSMLNKWKTLFLHLFPLYNPGQYQHLSYSVSTTE
jgi:hypothetical protein